MNNSGCDNDFKCDCLLINDDDDDDEVVFNEEGPILQLDGGEENVVFETSRINRNLHCKSYLPDFVKNSEEAALPASSTSSPSSSRPSSKLSDSSSSLGGSIGSFSQVLSDMISLNNEYQNLLRVATREIKKLNLNV